MSVNGNAVPIQVEAPSIPIPPNGVGLPASETAPQTSMLHALSHIPPQPPVPLPHPTENDNGEEERMTPLPDDKPAETIKLVIPAVKEIKGRKGKGKRKAVKQESVQDGDDDLTPTPVTEADVATAQAISGSRRRGKRISYAEDPAEDEQLDTVSATPRRSKAKKVITDEDNEAEPSEPSELSELSELDEKPVTTPKKRAKKPKATPKKKEDGDGEGAEDEKPAKVRKPTPKKSRLAKDEPEFDEDGNEIIKKKRKPKVYAKIEYDIPDVERKTTTFKGMSIQIRFGTVADWQVDWDMLV